MGELDDMGMMTYERDSRYVVISIYTEDDRAELLFEPDYDLAQQMAEALTQYMAHLGWKKV